MSDEALPPELPQSAESACIPIWLRRLALAKVEADAERDVMSPEEGLRLALELMAQAQNTLRESIMRQGRHLSDVDVAREIRQLRAQFAQLDARWLARWRRERPMFIAAMQHSRSQGVGLEGGVRGNAASEPAIRATKPQSKVRRKNVPEFIGQGLAESLWKAVDVLRACRMRYMLIGAVALSIWGRPRATLDLDFLVLTNVENIPYLQRRARAREFEVDEAWLEWNPLLRESQIRLLHGAIPVDILLPRDAHDQKALQRRCRRRLGKRMFWVTSPEDLILQKLKVGRPRDFEDAATVLARQHRQIDLEYLYLWAERLGILGELNYIRDSRDF